MHSKYVIKECSISWIKYTKWVYVNQGVRLLKVMSNYSKTWDVV